MKNKPCYYCGRPSTSKEHVPPKCLFPEQRDAQGQDYRKNLITVPSCDLHNSETSRDDEFLLACLAPIVGNNAVGFVQALTKLKRAIEHTDGHLRDISMFDAEPLVGTDDDGNVYPLLVGRPDDRRLDKCFAKIVRAIWYLENGKTTFDGRTSFLPGFLTYNSRKPDATDSDSSTGARLEYAKYLARVKLKEEFASVPIKGANREIFQYQIGPPDENSITPLLLTFYGSADVMCAMQPAGTPALVGSLDDMLAGTEIQVTVNAGTQDERQVTIRLADDGD